MAAPMVIPPFFSEFKMLRSRAPNLALYRLLFRTFVWKAYRITGRNAVLSLHGRSRMRLRALAQEHGIQTGIFLFHEEYEPSVRAAIDRFVEKDAVCYDIGANLGLWSLRMAENTGVAGRVFAFEPNSHSIEGLLENIALSDHANITVMPFALSDTEGYSALYIPDDAGSSSLAAESSSDAVARVLVKRLDDVWKEQQRPNVSFVKLDVEGAEPLVLRGGRVFFESQRPVTCCEVNPGKLDAMGFAPSAIFDVFAKLGYKAFTWSHRAGDLIAYLPSADVESTLDLVFVPD